MKKLLSLFMCLALVGLYSCSDDDDNNDGINDADKIEISATIQCKSDNGDYVPDAGATLYLFKNFSDYVNYEYTDGTYVHKTSGEVIKATQKAIANNQGVASLKADPDQKCLVVWESAKYKGKYGQNVYELKKGDAPINIKEIYFAP